VWTQKCAVQKASVDDIAERLTVLLRIIFVDSFILRTWIEMKTIGSSAVLLVGNFILHFIGLGLSQSFGIIYSELLTFITVKPAQVVSCSKKSPFSCLIIENFI
jgi:hypothetical protein